MSSILIKAVVNIIVELYNALSKSMYQISRITLICKHESPRLQSSYRPISLISVFGTVFEVVLKDQLYNYFETSWTLCNYQYSFCI